MHIRGEEVAANGILQGFCTMVCLYAALDIKYNLICVVIYRSCKNTLVCDTSKYYKFPSQDLWYLLFIE